MKKEDIFNQTNQFVYHHAKYLFTAIEVFHLRDDGDRNEFIEIHAGDTGCWREFDLVVTKDNITRLTDSYLQSVVEYSQARSENAGDEGDRQEWIEIAKEYQKEQTRRRYEIKLTGDQISITKT